MREAKGHKNESPFGTEFKPLVSRVETLENAPDKVFKKIDLEYLQHSVFETDDFFKATEQYKSLVSELSEKYGFNIPSMDYIIGLDENNNRVIFQVTDKIDGETLKEKKPNETSSADFDSLFASLVYYASDKILSGEPYLRDIFRIEQFMIGRTKKNPEIKIYLSDIDEQITKKGSQKMEYLNDFLRAIMDMMCNVKEKWNNARFDKTLDKFDELFENVPGLSTYGNLKYYYDNRIKKL